MSPTVDKFPLFPENGSKDDDFQMHPLESRSLRAFKSSEEYLYAMKEDLAEWLNTLYALNVTADNFLDKLETGHILCRHANSVLNQARKTQKAGRFPLSTLVPEKDLVYRVNVKPKTFQSRDNVSNFIGWCRKMQIHECLLFETDDLVLRKNERSFILCLLEVARLGSQFGLVAPLLVQMEQEIDRELAAEQHSDEAASEPKEQVEEEEQDEFSRRAKISKSELTNDLKSLQQKVADLLSHCSCPTRFPMIKVADGKYRIGDTKTLIFVRILRNHVMVRVGGGWDTLEHYLYKHDPCRCRSGHKYSTSTKLTLKSNKDGSQTELFVTFDRSRRHTKTPNSVESEGTSPSLSSGSTSRRSSSSSLGTYSMLHTYSTPNLVNSYLSSNLHDMQNSRISQYSDDSSVSSYISSSSSPYSPHRLSSDEELSPNTDLFFSGPSQLETAKKNESKARNRRTRRTHNLPNCPRQNRCRSLYLFQESEKDVDASGRRFSAGYSSTEELLLSKKAASEPVPDGRGPNFAQQTQRTSRIPMMTKAYKDQRFYISRSSKDLRPLGRMPSASDKFGFRGSVCCLANSKN